MRTEEIKVYKYEELSKKAKEKSREWYLEGALDYDWWDFIYEDAERAGIKITSFDLYRHEISGNFTDHADLVAHKIMNDHGEDCETYKTAKDYTKKRDELFSEWPRDEDREFVDTWNLDDELDGLDEEFLQSILEDYLIILRHELEYLESDAKVEESIIANEYEFTENGKIW